ncbi:MAG: hypothetical protein Q8O72_08485 [Bacteroidales bacterium]|nr:hypothetical protein [Bacteroidales bacterium]
MKNSSILMMILVMTVMIAGCKKDDSTEETPLDTTQHDNYFQILPDQFSPAFGYSYSGNHKITSGQPWGGVSSEGYHSGIEILAKAGRKDSDSPASWFKSNASNAISIVADKNTVWPEKLNFAFTGTITINGDSYPFTAGQGHSGAFNNWWIGGPGWTFPDNKPYEEIYTPDKKYILYCDEDIVHLFYVKEN